MPTLIHFIRHGTPVGGNRYRGHSIDDPLSDKGWLQMRTAVRSLTIPDRVVSSPMLRCLSFAEDYCEQHQLDSPIVDDRLKEVGFGDWEGKSSSEILAEDVAAIRNFYHDPIAHRPANAELLEDFQQRVADSLEELLNKYRDQRLLVVAHAGVMRAVIGHTLKTPLASLYKVSIGNAAIVTVKDDHVRPATLVIE